jgi:hypothetical protein
MFVIGVAGQAQMGKDSLSDRLAEKLNESNKSMVWARRAFAYNVKKVFCDTFGVDLDFVEKWKVIAENPPGFDMTVRQALQFIGDGFRKIQSTIWLDLAFRDKTEAKIISDVRYVNEFKRVHKEGGLNILIARPDKITDDPNGSEAQIKPYIDWCLNHFPSNLKVVDLRTVDWAWVYQHDPDGDSFPPDEIENFHLFVRNDGTKDELHELVDKQIVPLVQKFVFEFPSKEAEEEIECLISA